MQKKRFIQVGLGGFGRYWIDHVMSRLTHELKSVEAAAVADINPDTFAHARQVYQLPPEKCYTDLVKAFEENPADFVVVVVPPAFHETVVDLALAHGLDVLSEKPIADSMAACARVYWKVKRAGKKMAVTMSHRFDQDKQTLEREIRSGRHGPLNYVVCRFTHNCREFGSWGKFRHEIPDPLLIEGAVHHFDCMRALANSDAKRVYAVTWNPSWGQFAGDSTGLITIEMQNGVSCFYEGAKANASTMNGWGNEYFRAECENGTLELDRRWLRVLRGGPWDRPLAEDIRLQTQPAWLNPWIAEMFVDWLNGGPPPPSHLEDNIQCCALLFAAIRSAKDREPVDVQEFLQQHLAEAETGH